MFHQRHKRRGQRSLRWVRRLVGGTWPSLVELGGVRYLRHHCRTEQRQPLNQPTTSKVKPPPSLPHSRGHLRGNTTLRWWAEVGVGEIVCLGRGFLPPLQMENQTMNIPLNRTFQKPVVRKYIMTGSHIPSPSHPSHPLTLSLSPSLSLSHSPPLSLSPPLPPSLNAITDT